MTFINKKEEVFDLVMTERGREKLSKGKFKPHSYSFYDNEVIYDNKYAAMSESQNSAQPRIKKTLMTQEKVTWNNSVFSPDRKDPLNYPNYFEIGGYDYTQQYRPAWKIYASEGNITGSIKQFPIELEKTGKVTSIEDYKHDKIPQLNVFCEYEIYEVKVGDKVRVYVKRSSNDLRFAISEENVFDDRENFILEVMQFTGDNRNLKKLEFINEKDPLTTDHVEHFFNISTDTDEVLDINYSDGLAKLEIEVPKDECEENFDPGKDFGEENFDPGKDFAHVVTEEELKKKGYE